ncbi:lipopolysaccharide biosynthesis protein [Candidatus Laterigemmans baculatus]|uniref:lipopolysaccharide biosynthesis protein n=1 Tax=Candidatus Laterigemmans baculatus TaxID=2770505 RepID=UPI0013DB6847|nr:lipopolysaccharide biosynthesis protein [Candidatus Laterigemmans baculatus]
MSDNRHFRADSLALGMLVMLIMTVVQRGIGFVRGIWFCRLMDDAALGQWAMAFGFISMGAPMLLLGMPGSLSRYVEHFRLQGHLRGFVGRIAAVTGLLSTAGVAWILLWPQPFGRLIFRDAADLPLIQAVAGALAAVIAFNFMNDLVASLRQVRVVSLMQFLQSVGFTILGVVWLWQGGELAGLVVCFAAATLVGLLPGWWIIVRGWPSLPASDTRLDGRSMWRRILPYAASLWMMNLLANTFELTDRYMLLHLSGSGPEWGQKLVGQYHSSRIVPGLLTSLATMASGVLLPYLAADWERGRRRAVAERLRRVLLGCAVVFTAGAAAALWLMPWLFQSLLAGRYDGGLAVMPAVFVFCIWSAIVTLAQDYLWVAERGRLIAVLMAVALAANVGLNRILVPPLGLEGAVLATLVANGLLLLGVWWSMQQCGYRMDRTSFWVTLLPATLLAGPLAAGCSVLATVAVSPHARRYLAELVAAAGCQFRGLAR